MSSTYSKGDSFEKTAYELIKRLVENDEFFVPGKRSKVFRKKGYYSSIRKSDIIFDISIETFINNAPNYSTLTLIECKNLNRKVESSDISEFANNLTQIGEHNTKGVFITKVGFQQGAYQTAVSYGITLIRLSGNDEYEWIHYRKPKFIERASLAELTSAFTIDKLEGRNLIASANGQPFHNLSDIFMELKVIDFYTHKEKFIKTPYVSEERIEGIIKRLEPYDVYELDRLNTDKLCEVLKQAYQAEFDFDSHLNYNILGKIEFDPIKISVTKSLKPDINRWRFTLAHEIGHLVLHSPILKFSIDQKSDTESTISLDANISDASSRQMEYQANLFARHLLLPDPALYKIVSRYFVENSIQKGFLFLDAQPINKNLVFTLLSNLSDHFQVSVEAAKVRLKAAGLLKDITDNSIMNIMRKNRFK
jgi:Zn-dependent peptidase ImmA (M78 family)